MGEEKQVERDAERIVEVEERLEREYLDSEEDDPDVSVELSASGLVDAVTSDIEGATLLSAERTDDTVDLDVAVDGDRVTFPVEYPDDPTDETEPLVRLCQWGGVPVTRLGDLSEVPVTTADSRPRLVFPEARHCVDVEVAVPKVGTYRTEVERPTSRLSRYKRTIFLRSVVATPLASAEDDVTVTPAPKRIGGVAFTVLLAALLAVMGVGDLAGLAAFTPLTVLATAMVTVDVTERLDGATLRESQSPR